MARPSREAQILAGALAAFAEHGYDAVRVRDIAARAEVSEGALYSHYASKEELALALFRTHMGRYSEALREAAVGRDVPVAERIKAVALRSLDAFAEDSDAFAFVLTHQGRFIGALPVDFPFPIRIIEALVRKGQRDGSVRKGPVRLLAALSIGCVLQPVRTVLEAPPGTVEVRSAKARKIIAEGAWAVIAAA